MALIGDFARTDHVVAGIRVGIWGKQTTIWEKKRRDTRIVRERALNAQNSLPRLIDSVKGDINLRGRCCRAYLISAILNLMVGRIFTTASRLLHVIPLAGFYIFLPKFWQGMLTRSHWHKIEKSKEEGHYRTQYPDMEVKSQKW
jgi:hypothetical protein